MSILVGATVFPSAYPGQGLTRVQADAKFDSFINSPDGGSRVMAGAKGKTYFTESQWPAGSNNPQPVGNLAAAGTRLLLSFKPGRATSYSGSTVTASGRTVAQEKSSLSAALALISAIPGINYEVCLWQECNLSGGAGAFGDGTADKKGFPSPYGPPGSVSNAQAATNYQNYVAAYGPLVTGAGVGLVYDPGISTYQSTFNFFATGLGFTKAYVDYYCNDFTGSKGITLDQFETFCDANSLPLGIGEFGISNGKQNIPTAAQFVSWAETQIRRRFAARLAAGKPCADVMWYSAGTGPNGINSSTDPRIIRELDKIYDTLTAPVPPPPPPPPPPGPPPLTLTGAVNVTYGPPGALDSVMAAADMAQGSVWPAGTVRQRVALDSQLGTVLMPNPQTIPATLFLQGSPPLNIPGASTGQILVSDASGNFTPANGVSSPAAAVNFKPASPAGTSSATLVMMGIGSVCTFTPATTGKIRVDVTGQMGQQTAVVINLVGGRYGTGAAPANGAAVTGTRFGGSQDASIRPSINSVASTADQIGFTDIIAGLTVGTAYWFDLALATGNAADQVYLQNISVSIEELVS